MTLLTFITRACTVTVKRQIKIVIKWKVKLHEFKSVFVPKINEYINEFKRSSTSKKYFFSSTHPFLVLGLSLWCCGRAGKPPGEGTGPSITTAIANKSEKKRKGKQMQCGTNTNLCKNYARDVSKDVQARCKVVVRFPTNS